MINIVLVPFGRTFRLPEYIPDAGLAFLDTLRVRALEICRSNVHIGAFCRQTLQLYEIPPRKRTLIRRVLATDGGDSRSMLEQWARKCSNGSPEGIAVFNPSFFLSEEPNYRELIDRVRETGLAISGLPSNTDIYGIAFSLETMTNQWARVAELLRQLTVCIDDQGEDYRNRHSEACFVLPSSQGVENSPAVQGVQKLGSLRAHDAPGYVNRAFAEILFNSVDFGKVGDDPLRMGAVLLAHREISKVPWIFNELLNQIEHRTGNIWPESLPPEVHLAVTGACNIFCRFCSYTRDIARFDFLKPDRFRQLNILRYLRALRLSSGLGEPTLNKHLPAILSYVTENFPHIEMNFFTNGVLLDRKNLLPSIFNSGVHWINVSLNAANRDTWAELHGVDQFDRVRRNLTAILAEKRVRGCIHPIMQGSMVLTRMNLEELPRMPALCRELGIDRFTAFPFFGFGYGGHEKFGPEAAYHYEKDRYERLYFETIEEGKTNRVSLEIPPPNEKSKANFGIENRNLFDFASVETNAGRLGKLLNGLNFPVGPDAHCFFLWRQVGIGATNKTLGETPETHYLYPCLGPLSSINLVRTCPVRFAPGEDFHAIWRNTVFTHLRKAQNSRGVNEVCDLCRSSDTRHPEMFDKMNRALANFSIEEIEKSPIILGQSGSVNVARLEERESGPVRKPVFAGAASSCDQALPREEAAPTNLYPQFTDGPGLVRFAGSEEIQEFLELLEESDRDYIFSEADRDARWEQIEELTRRYILSEADRDARWEQIVKLTHLAQQAQPLHIILGAIQTTWIYRLFRKFGLLEPLKSALTYVFDWNRKMNPKVDESSDNREESSGKRVTK